MKKKIVTALFVGVLICLLVSMCACGTTTEKEKQTSGDLTVDAVYAAVVESGVFEGSMEDFLNYIKGDSAYQTALEQGFEGTEKEWLEYLKGKDGMDGTSAALTAADFYNEAVKQGYTGDYLQFLRDYLSASTEESIKSNNLFSSVSIFCNFSVAKTAFTFRGLETYSESQASAGSGVIYSINKSAGSAYIITNYHVVYNVNSEQQISDNIVVCLYGSEILGSEFYNEKYYGENARTEAGMGIPATYVGGSMHYDIAVLRIENSDLLKNSSAVAVEFANSNDVVASQTAYAVGNAGGDGISVTKGIVSVDSENLTMTMANDSETTTFRVIRIDTAVNSGNSGGGLFDADGKLIGIVNAKTIESGVENIGYALPSNVVKYVVENIIDYKDSAKKGDVRKCMLGITISSTESRAVYDETEGKVRIKETVSVNDVLEDGLAHEKLQAGDVLVAVKIHHKTDEEGVYAEYTIDRSFIIVDLMLTMRVGDKLVMVYDRKAEDGTVSRGQAEFSMTEKCISEVN